MAQLQPLPQTILVMLMVLTLARANLISNSILSQPGSSGQSNSITPDGADFPMNCPDSCVCQGASVDCSYRGLTSVPAGIPPIAQRL